MSDHLTNAYGWDTAEAKQSSAYINPTVRRFVRESGARNVLDAGCGNGALCGELLQDGLDVTGIDADEGGIEIARTTYPGARFEVASFAGSPRLLFPAAAQGFDCVVSTEVIEHLYAPHEFARFCFEALRPGGTLVVSTPYHGYLKNLILSLTDKWDDHHTALWYGGHIKFWSAKTLRKLLGDAGFEMREFAGVGRAPYVWKSMILVARRPRGFEPITAQPSDR